MVTIWIVLFQFCFSFYCKCHKRHEIYFKNTILYKIKNFKRKMNVRSCQILSTHWIDGRHYLNYPMEYLDHLFYLKYIRYFSVLLIPKGHCGYEEGESWTNEDSKCWDSILFGSIARIMGAVTFFPIIAVFINSPITHTRYTCLRKVHGYKRVASKKILKFEKFVFVYYLCRQQMHIYELHVASDRPLKIIHWKC